MAGSSKAPRIGDERDVERGGPKVARVLAGRDADDGARAEVRQALGDAGVRLSEDDDTPADDQRLGIHREGLLRRGGRGP